MAAAAEATTATDMTSRGQQQQTGVGISTRKWTTGYKYESKLPIEKLWAVGGDFAGVQKWLPGVATCDITGDPTQPGCLRRCIFEGFSEGALVVAKLLMLNNEEHLLKYSVLENFMGYKDYVATFNIEPNPSPSTSAESGGTSNGGCTVSWSMEVAPVEGKSEEEVVQSSSMIISTAFKSLEACASNL